LALPPTDWFCCWPACGRGIWLVL